MEFTSDTGEVRLEQPAQPVQATRPDQEAQEEESSQPAQPLQAGDPSRRKRHTTPARESLRQQYEEVRRGHKELTEKAEKLLKSRIEQHDIAYREVQRKDMNKETRLARAAEYKAKWQVLKEHSRELLELPSLWTALSEDDFARLTALANRDDSEDEFRQMMKLAAADLLQRREVVAKQSRDWNEAFAIKLQAYFPGREIVEGGRISDGDLEGISDQNIH
ncbi:hypothetical protein BKA61DRAFT_688199 [Leptodontidium sp. MPI-SDFR-AT-0119]|nr:hypothetical protein BKA61DRAFT_688199 [Leptodontidium sp. MPI-SDFR-AT-0119]